ncbi:hypothetical protein NQ315_003783 [Exocentrus adspersus]|uniref:Transposase n=1 Tax=Exocentrus adspersus TaxID=1586481 RepID=A0AAV8V7W5_9CUCU|nr:hypothetical protein NQ315_003783 [Exocentrus adspersus]
MVGYPGYQIVSCPFPLLDTNPSAATKLILGMFLTIKLAIYIVLLPSIRTLKDVLSKIPFDTGINPSILQYLKLQVQNMDELDNHCTLIFDEVSLGNGFQYDTVYQKTCGYEDLGSLGRTHNVANHALVFMVRGIRKSYKQVVAYYFTSDTVKTPHLKCLIVEIIKQIQSTGLQIVATVCDQGPTNRAALRELCAENRDKPSPFYFMCTRNALLRCKIEYDSKRYAKFEHIEAAFRLDQQKRTYRQMYKLKPEYFNFKDSFIKMKVKVAANQLSHTVAASIETFSALGLLPSESLHTAEFVHDVDNLFDSLNGTGTLFSDGKQFRCSLSEVSPHLEFWSKLLPKIKNWKLIDFGTSKDCTKQYHFVEGWQLTIRSVIYIWNNLRQKGLRYLSLRSLNQDPLENLFGQIRQHGISNSNPTCHQFVAALKTVVVNNLTVPLSKNQNCEDDNCTPLGDFCSFLLQQSAIDSNSSGSDDCDLTDLQCYSVEDNDNQGTTYVAGYILSKIKVPDCEICRRHLYSPDVQQNHLFVTFKEYDDK